MSETAVPAPASTPAAGEPQGTSAQTTETTGGIIVHHLNNSRSQRILWLLVRYTFCPLWRCLGPNGILGLQEELEVPYSIKVGWRN